MGVDRTLLPPMGPPAALAFPAIARHTLPSGVRLCTVDHPATPLVSFVLLLRSGAAADPAGGEGLAALTAALLDEGSDQYTALELHQALGDIGARVGTDVVSDCTVVSVTALARHAAESLRLLVEVATRPRVAADDLERARRRRLARIAQQRHAAGVVADRLFLETLYGRHPYGHRAIGTESGLQDVDREMLRQFHRSHYGLDRWTLVAVGGAGPDALHAVVEEQLADRPALEPALVPAPPVDPSPSAQRLVFVPREGAVQSEIRVGSLGVARSVNHYAAIGVMDTVLGGQFTSRLNLNLREDKGYTYGVRSSFDARRGRGPFSVRTAVDAAATAAALREVVREVEDIRGRRPVTDEELQMARSALTRGFVRRFETAGQLARAAMRLELFELPDDEYSTFVGRVGAVGPAEVTAAAEQHLDPSALLAVVVGPPSVRDSLAGLGLGEPAEVDP